MEKTLKIDNKEVTFRSTGAAPLRYKKQFGKDFFSDLAKLEKALDKKGNVNVDYLDFEIFYNIAYVFAKSADPSISDPDSWLDSFDSFPIMEVCEELQELLLNSFSGSKSKENARKN